MQIVSMFMLALPYLVHGSTDGAASAPPQGWAMLSRDVDRLSQDIDRLLLAESDGDRRREGQGKNNFDEEDASLHNPALAHLLEKLEQHAHKTDASQGRRRVEGTSVNATDTKHGCTNVAYPGIKYQKDYFRTEVGMGSTANSTEGWSMCASTCNDDRDCLAWTWGDCGGNTHAGEMCCNLIHRHYLVMPEWGFYDDDTEFAEGFYSGTPCAPRYVYDRVLEDEGGSYGAFLASDGDTVTWQIRDQQYKYDAAMLGYNGPGCRVKQAGDITRTPEDSDSDLLVMPAGTTAYRFHVNNEDIWTKSYCQKVTCEETSVDRQHYDRLTGKVITEYAWGMSYWHSTLDDPMWTRSEDCWDKALELYGWRDHIKRLVSFN